MVVIVVVTVEVLTVLTVRGEAFDFFKQQQQQQQRKRQMNNVMTTIGTTIPMATAAPAAERKEYTDCTVMYPDHYSNYSKLTLTHTHTHTHTHSSCQTGRGKVA